MLFPKVLGRVALAANAALSTYPTPVHAQETGQSVFVSPDNLVTFAFAAPTDHNRDVYFSLRVHQSVTWGAVGLGSDDMPNSLILMLYHDDEGTGVTFSPRIAFGNYEPEYYSHMRWEVLDGTGIQDDYLVFNARCTDHCRTWLHGSLDVFDHDQKAIWAVGPDGSLRSDDMDAPLPMHRQFGGFEIDMGRTNKVNATSISADAKNIGTEARFHHQSHRDLKSRFHAIFMIMSVCVLLPAGILCLRAGQMVRWHGIVQSIALVFAIVGVSLGIVTSFLYQRSRGFNDKHQIIGLVVFGLFFGQFVLGILHHLQFKRTNKPTKLQTPHRWTGRIILFVGTFNAFLGFSFALNRQEGYFLAALVIAVCGFSLFFMFGQGFLRRRQQRHTNGPFYGGHPSGQEPWRHQGQAQPGGGNAGYQPGYGFAGHAAPAGYAPPGGPLSPGGYAAPPPYEGPPPAQGSGASIGLSTMSPASGRDRERDRKDGDGGDLGPVQTPRETL
ncbi:hypothetical protein BN1708_000652 [Verticillium longisporum]|uniref:Cytochrome b561 domain-containing protein n=1 Tax=Verticillium longisporum TaxID=100787 RepID=A0A0G4LXV1_VERLO|nr:hypothetical protein BN1708_000652 [Verticillium longisporum]